MQTAVLVQTVFKKFGFEPPSVKESPYPNLNFKTYFLFVNINLNFGIISTMREGSRLLKCNFTYDFIYFSLQDVKAADFDYLLGMAMWSLTQEKIDDLLKKKGDKHKELKK